MDKFLIKKSLTPSSHIPTGNPISSNEATVRPCNENKVGQSSTKRCRIDVNISELPIDPGLRVPISTYHPNIQDEVRRAYMQMHPCQPTNHIFPFKKIGKKDRRFNPAWFQRYPNWLEYSVVKDAAFCRYCYLFRTNYTMQGGSDTFISKGWNNWKDKSELDKHVGGPNSAHNLAREKCENLMKQAQHIETTMHMHDDLTKRDYRTRLFATVNVIRVLLSQGLAFRGHYESEESSNKGNFLTLLKAFAKVSIDIKDVVLENAPENNKLISPKIQKDVTRACAMETRKIILKELGDSFFTLLLDESRDISNKEQMAIVLRFVNSKGQLIERFLELIHVRETSAVALKEAIDEVFARYSLSVSRLRGQGYDGASNMRREFNDLKSIILKENSSAYYIHCFAHQLQLAMVAVARNNDLLDMFFTNVARLSSLFTTSCKKTELLKEAETIRIAEALDLGELETGTGANQEKNFVRPGDTRWGSHYRCLINLLDLYPSLIKVLEFLRENKNLGKHGEALEYIRKWQDFEYIFCLHLMIDVLGVTYALSQSLQRKDQDIINAMSLVSIAKQCLQEMRDGGWTLLMERVCLFCKKHNVDVPSDDDLYTVAGRSRRNIDKITVLHHYRVQIFYTIIDMQAQELNDRFTEANTELLLCVACLSPKNSFAAFDVDKLIRLAQLYPLDFSSTDLLLLRNEMLTYIKDVKQNTEFLMLKFLTELTEKMVKTQKDLVYPMVYLLMKLALTLPVATASVERAFSAMNIVKTRLRNRMGDEWMSDALLTYIEREVFDSIGDDDIIDCFQNMKSRRGQL